MTWTSRVLAFFRSRSELRAPCILFVVAISAMLIGLCCQTLTAESTIERVVSAAEQREQKHCRLAYVKWTMRERASPESFGKRYHPDLPKLPTNEHDMRRVHSLILGNGAWRLDRIGNMLYKPGGYDEPDVWPVTKVQLYDTASSRWYTQVHGVDKEGRGQLTKKYASHNVWHDDFGHMPVFVFARPLQTGLFQEIKSGKYREISDKTNSDGLVCLIDKAREQSRIWLDATRDFIPVRMSWGKSDFRIEYSTFEQFGLAPSKWSCIKTGEDDSPIRIYLAHVLEWHRRADEIKTMLDYKYPKGTEVVDLDTSEKYLATESGRLIPVTQKNPDRDNRRIK